MFGALMFRFWDILLSILLTGYNSNGLQLLTWVLSFVFYYETIEMTFITRPRLPLSLFSHPSWVIENIICENPVESIHSKWYKILILNARNNLNCYLLKLSVVWIKNVHIQKQTLHQPFSLKVNLWPYLRISTAHYIWKY